MRSKVAMSGIIATALLVSVAVLTAVSLSFWQSSFQSEWNAKIQLSGNSGPVEIVELLYFNSTHSILGVKNRGSAYHVVDEIRIENQNCIPTRSNVIEYAEKIYVDCGVTVNNIYEVVLFTDKGVFTKTLTAYKSGIMNCDDLVGGEWVGVSGNSELGVDSFCVMKYEAKEDSSGNCLGGDTNNCPVSQAAGLPWVSITWQDAKTECESLGEGYNLISENQWLTMAHDIIDNPNNWADGVIGSQVSANGGLFRGNVNSNDSVGCGSNVVLNAVTEGANCEIDSGIYLGRNKRTLEFSNGEILWDLSGNVHEYIDELIDYDDVYHGGNQEWMKFYVDAINVPVLKLPPNSWNHEQGMGAYFDGNSLAGAYNSVNEAPDFCTGQCSSVAVFRRGGYWIHEENAGVFTLTFRVGRSYRNPDTGFRCSYSE